MDSAIEVVQKPKNKGGRPRKEAAPAVSRPVADAAPRAAAAPLKVGDFLVSEGFSWITVFPVATDPPNKKVFCGPWQVGDHVPITFMKGVPQCLPNCVINTITDSVNLIPEDDIDLAGRRDPVRTMVPFTRFPHTDPVPATWQEYKAMRDAQAPKEHPNAYTKRMASR